MTLMETIMMFTREVIGQRVFYDANPRRGDEYNIMWVDTMPLCSRCANIKGDAIPSTFSFSAEMRGREKGRFSTVKKPAIKVSATHKNGKFCWNF